MTDAKALKPLPTPTKTEESMGDKEHVLGEGRRRLLVQVARVLFPHEGLPDGPYERAVAALAAQAARSPILLHLLLDGIAELDEAMKGGTAPGLLDVLVAQEGTPFFQTVRSRVAFALYDDREMWSYVGYPGASFHLGGYLHRGFDDLSWLPDPRIVENSRPLPEIGPLAVVEDRTA